MAVLAMALGWLGAVPHAAAQQDGLVGGDSYISAEYGWSVEFDDRTWEADELDTSGYVGVRLGLEDVGFVDVGVYADLEDTDAEECLEILDAFYTGGDTWEDLKPARGLDLPETDRAAEAELYEGAVIIDSEGVDAALYLECREVDGAALTVEFTALEGTYEDALPDLEELLAGIDTDGASTRDDDGPEDLGETDLDGGVYVGQQFGFRVEWNINLWSDPEDLAEDGVEGREGIYLVAPGGGSAQIFSQDTSPNYGVDECLDDNVDGWQQAVPDLEDFVPDDGQEIAWPRGVESAQAIGTLELEDGSEAVAVFSAACLELGDGEDYLIMGLTSRAEGYEENAVAFNDILDSLTFAATSDDEPRSDDDPAADDEPADDDEPTADDDGPADDDEPADDEDVDARDLGETDLEAGVYVGAIPYRFEWDPDDYEAMESINGGAIILTATDDETTVISFTDQPNQDEDSTPQDCAEGYASVYEDYEPYDPPAGEEIAWPDGAGVVQLTGESGFDPSQQRILQIGCAEVVPGEAYVTITFGANEENYADRLEDFNDILDSFVISE